MTNIKLASRLDNVRVSPTVAFSARARELKEAGRDIVSLSSGEPDFDTPEHIRQAAHQSIHDGHTHYTVVEGITELRRAICNKLRRDNDLDYQPDQVCVSSGGKQVIFNAMMATLERDDEVVMAAPYWVSYPDIVALFGGKPVIVETTESNGFRMTAEELETAITPRTRWLILNSPSNPSGAMYSREDFQALGAVLERHPDVWVLTDDIYETIVYGGTPFVSFARAVPDMKARTLTLNGLSKSHAMTGWRVGYGAGDRDLIRAMNKIQGQSTLHTCSIAQWAGVTALEGPQDAVATMLESFTRRRNNTLKALEAIEGLRCFPPDGAFYLFVSIQDLLDSVTPAGTEIRTDHDWVMALMEEQGVALVPGSAFGTPGYFRLSFAAADDQLEKACERIAAFSGGLRGQG
jgi:aspartate aminotransferase